MSEYDEDKIAKTVLKVVGFTVLGIVLLIVIFGSFYIVRAGERGVLLTFGKADMIAKGEGLNFKIPIVQKAIRMNVQTQKYEANLSAASRDLQDVSTKIAINYRIIAEKAPEIYREIGLSYAEKIIYPLEQETNKAITSQYTAEELIARREEVREKMKETLANKLMSRNIIVEEISIVDFKFSEQFNAAIENKVVQEQLKSQKGIELERAKIEAQTKIVYATAEAEALRLQKQQITPELLELRKIENNRLAIEKWNSILPTVLCGGNQNTNPFVNVGDFVTK